MPPLLIRCLSMPVIRPAARAIRRVVRRLAPAVGSAAPAARRAALATRAVRLGGLACLMAPLLAPGPAMGPHDTPPRATAQDRAPPGGGLPAALQEVALRGGLTVLPSASGLMEAAASVTGFETRTVAQDPPGPPPRRVAVPEPASAGLFIAGILALLWTRRRRRAASALDGTGARR